MAAFVLPTTTPVPDFTFQTELDAVTYGLHLYWNERLSAWFMDILDVSGNALVTGIRLVVGFPLASRTRYNTALPPGALIASDTSGQDLDPGLDDLGGRVQLLYYSVTPDGQ